jgi:maltose O-acetyltransferase
MFKIILRYAIQIAAYVKYRSTEFKSIGTGCIYKSLSTKFVNARNISIGDYTQIGPRCLVDGTGGVSFGKGCILAPEVVIYSRTHNFNSDLNALPFDDVTITNEVAIGNYVWIGLRAIILPGVSIGDGAVIGAGAVVSKDVASCAVVVGNPAKAVRYRDLVSFAKLASEDDPFVYKRYGRKKRFLKATKKSVTGFNQ